MSVAACARVARVGVAQRLDYAAIEEEYAVALEDRAEARRDAKAKAKKRPAPPQKAFDYAWFSASGAASEVQRSRWPKAASLAETWRDAHKEFFVFEGQHYLNGFLYKEVGIDATLDQGNVMPSIEQVIHTPEKGATSAVVHAFPPLHLETTRLRLFLYFPQPPPDPLVARHTFLQRPNLYHGLSHFFSFCAALVCRCSAS